MVQEAPQRRRFLIVHNPHAGRRRTNSLDEVCGRLTAAGAVVTRARALSIEDDRRLAGEALTSGRFDAVVAAGGDSTIRGVASALVGTSLPLGIIPVGTGNVLAEEIGLPRSAKAVSECLLTGACVRIVPGMAGRERFLLMASAGYDVRVLARLDMAWKRRIGKLAYGWPALTELFRHPQSFEVTVDGRTLACAWMIVTKVAHYAGSFVIAPRQNLASPGFHAVVVKSRTRAALASAVIAGGLGLSHRHPQIEVIPCRSVEIPLGQSVPVQLDGEPVPHALLASGPLVIEPGDEPLWLIAPEGARLAQVERAAGIPTVS